MPIRVSYNNDPQQKCTLRPVPFMSIGTSVLKNGAGEAFGAVYTITIKALPTLPSLSLMSALMLTLDMIFIFLFPLTIPALT